MWHHTGISQQLDDLAKSSYVYSGQFLIVVIPFAALRESSQGINSSYYLQIYQSEYKRPIDPMTRQSFD